MTRKKKTRTVRVAVELDVQDIASEWSGNEAFDFIVALDAAFQDWSFTLRLHEHFAKLKAECEKEESEDAARRAP